MGLFPLGNQRVGIVTVPVASRTDYFEAVDGTPVVEWVDGALLEVQSVSEQQGDTVTTSELADVWLPVLGDQVPIVNADGSRSHLKPVADITANLVLRDGDTGLDYVMRGDAVLQRTLRNRPDHAECRAERETP